MFRKNLIASALAAAILSANAHAAADRGSDIWKEASIATAFTLNEQLNPFTINVEVRNGVAYINGEVESMVEKNLAQQIAAGVDGIDSVHNDLTVSRDVQRRTTGNRFAQAVSDATITARVKSQLLWNQSTGGLDVNVTTRDGVVSLQGTVDSQAEADLIRRIARNTEGVAEVTDTLALASTKVQDSNDAEALKRSAEKTIKSIERSALDAWVTTKVKSALLYRRGIDATHIKVETVKGVVTLTGTVEDESERDRAVRTARQVTGVKDVDARLTIDPTTRSS